MKRVIKCFLLVLFLFCLVYIKPANATDIEFNSVDIDLSLFYLNIKDDIIRIRQKMEDPCMPRNLEELEGKKLIAFTFDDGPSKNTLKLLDNLEKYDARVTFFVTGNRVNNFKNTLTKAYQQCNQIGNHTYNHYNLLKKTEKTVKNEITKTNDAIYNIIGEYPVIMRPPYGNTNSKIRKIGNLPTILWSIDTLDWKYRNADRIANTIINNAKDGAIILLHDLYSTSVEGALMAMEELKDEYAFVTIEEMVTIKGIELNSNKSYTKFK